MAEPLLAVRDLRSGYGAGDILQGVSLQASRGEIIAAIGRNGVGKTTLMKTIIGLLPTRSGEIRFAGRDLTRDRAETRARLGLGYVPQGKQIFPDLTVEENLRMGARVNGARPSRIDLALDFFPVLRERLRQKGSTLSGGEQQGLAIARALVGQPELLLLDEPSESIQPNTIIAIGETLNKLNQETGLAIIVVEQNLGLIEAVAQRGYVIDKGRTVAEVSREDIRNRDHMLQFLSV